MSVRKFDRDTVLKDLRENACEVRFTKVNGEERVMHCTLMDELLPQAADMNYIDDMHKKPDNKDVIVVWDLQKHGWRSFRVDSVAYVQAVDGY